MSLGSRKEEAADQGPKSCGELKPQQRFNAGSLRGFRAKGPEEAGDTDWPWIQKGKGVQAGSEESKGPPGGLRGLRTVPGSRGMSQGALGRTGVTRGVPRGCGPGRGPEERPRAFWAEMEITGGVSRGSGPDWGSEELPRGH